MNRFIVPGLVVVAAVTGTATLAIAITDPSGRARPAANAARADRDGRRLPPAHDADAAQRPPHRPKVVSVELDASLGRGADQTWLPPLRVDDGDNGLRLLDEVNGRSSVPLRDAEGECLCTDLREVRGAARRRRRGLRAGARLPVLRPRPARAMTTARAPRVRPWTSI